MRRSGVAHGADHVQRLLVTELPRPRCAGQLAGRARVADVVVAAVRGLQRGEHPTQGRTPQPPHRLGGQLQPAVGPGEVALALELALDLAQPFDVVDRRPAEGAADRLRVDVVQAGAGVGLPERLLQLLEVGQLLQRRRGVADAEPLLAVHPAATVPVQVGPARAQLVAEVAHLGSQVEVGQRLVHQLAELGALLRSQAVHHPLGGRGAAGEGVDQLLEVLRLVREQVAVRVHERVEVGLRVLAAGVGVEHRVEVGEHVLQSLQRLRVRVLQRLLEPAELPVEHLPAQQVLQLLERRPAPAGCASRTRRARAPRATSRTAASPAASRAAVRRRTGRGTARRAPRRPPCPAARGPPPACRPGGRARAARGPGGGPAGAASSRPRRPSVPRLSRSRRACAGDVPAITSSPTRSSASATSNGAASGSGPSSYGPYRTAVLISLRRTPCGRRSRPWRCGAGGTAPRARTPARPLPSPATRRPRRPAGSRSDRAPRPDRPAAAAPRPGPARRSRPSRPPRSGRPAPDRSVPARRRRNVSATARRSRCRSTSISRPSSDASNSTLPRSVGTIPGRSPTRATASLSPVRAARRSALAATVSAPATGNRAETPERWSTAEDSRTIRVNRASTSTRWCGTLATSSASCCTSAISSSTRSG